MSLKNLNSLSRTAKETAKRKKTGGKKALVRTLKKGSITSYTLLYNGLTVLYAHVPGSETVTTSIVYAVGSRHEETGDTGLAHMLEHMLFKHTSGKGTKWKDLESKGAHLNATTWLDRTLYYFTLPREYLGAMLEVEADRMRNTIITDSEFHPERANVLSEYEIQNGSPGEVLGWNVIATAFQNHGYHHDTIGWRGDIENYTTAQLKHFYDRYYWPNNATLIVAGDIDEHTLTKAVLGCFGSIPHGEVYQAPHRVEAPQHGARRATVLKDTPLRILQIAYKAPAFTHLDWLPLSVALQYLAGDETSPLYKALVDTHLGTRVEYGMYPTHDPFLAFITVYGGDRSMYDTIEKTVYKVLAREAQNKISQKKLDLILESVKSEEANSRDGSRAIALTLSEYVATGDWKKYVHTFDDIASITIEDISRVMKKYLIPSQSTIGTLHTPHETH